MTDRIEKSVDLIATPARVWRAVTHHGEFGTWFGVALEGPFVVGREVSGRIIYPGMEQLVMTVHVVAIDPMRRFAFEWHPFAIDPAVDYTAEPRTLVEFTLTPTPDGTKLTVVESGFDKVPAHRRAEAFRMNEGGWAAQMDNIRAHVGG